MLLKSQYPMLYGRGKEFVVGYVQIPNDTHLATSL